MLTKKALPALIFIILGLIVSFIKISKFDHLAKTHTFLEQYLAEDFTTAPPVLKWAVSGPMVLMSHVHTPMFHLTNLKLKLSWWQILTDGPQIKEIQVDSLNFSSPDLDVLKYLGDLSWFKHLPTGGKMIFKKISLLSPILQIELGEAQIKNHNFTIHSKDYGILKGTIKRSVNQQLLSLEWKHLKNKISATGIYQNDKFNTGKVDGVLAYLEPDARQALPITISLNMASDERGLKLSDIILTGQPMQAKGEVLVSSKGHQVDLSVQELKLDMLMSFMTENILNLRHFKPATIQQIQLKIDTLSYKLENLRKLNFTAHRAGTDELVVDLCTGFIGAEGAFNVVGKVISNDYRPLFYGRGIINHQNLGKYLGDYRPDAPLSAVLSGDLIATPGSLEVHNFFGDFKEYKLKGKFAAKFIGDIPRFSAQLLLDNLDFTSPEKLAVILASYRATDKSNAIFNPLRNLSYLGSLDLVIDQLLLPTKRIEDINLKLFAKKGELVIQELSAISENEPIKASATIDASYLRPQIALNMRVDRFSLEQPQGLMQYVADLLKTQVDFNIATNIKHLSFGKRSFQNLQSVIHNQDNILKLDNCSMQLTAPDSQITVQGYLTANPIRISLVYSGNQINLIDPALDLPTLLQVPGTFSTNGKLSLVWLNEQELAKGLYDTLTLQGSFIGKGLQFNNLGIDDLIDKVRAPDYNWQNLPEDTNNFVNQGTTKIPQISGQYNLLKELLAFEQINFNTNDTIGTAAANIDLARQEIALAALMKFYTTEEVQFKLSSITNLKLTIKGKLTALEKLIEITRPTDSTNKQ